MRNCAWFEDYTDVPGLGILYCQNIASRRAEGRWLCEWHADVVEGIDPVVDPPTYADQDGRKVQP